MFILIDLIVEPIWKKIDDLWYEEDKFACF